MKKAAVTLKEATSLLIRRFFAHSVGKNGAALAYYLLFALFPLLIFVSNLLGQLNIDMYSVTKWLDNFLPGDTVKLFESYFEYVDQNSSSSMLGFSLVFTVYFPMRATKSLMHDVRRAYGLSKPERPVVFVIKQIVFTLVLLLSIAVTLVLSTLSQRVIKYILKSVRLDIHASAISLWHYLRFLFIGVFVFGAVALFYALSQDKKQPVSATLPGAVAAVIAWLTVSVGFSFYVENFSKYSAIYGALGTVIVLMLWLYITSVILIMGAELNQTVFEIREKSCKNS